MIELKSYLKRFKNRGTLMGVVGTAGLLVNQFGVNIDLVWLNHTADLICSLLVILGIVNNPDTKGVDLPTTKSTEIE